MLVLLVALMAALAMVRALVAVPVRVESASMVPTFRAGDVILVSRHRPALGDLRHGDLLAFRSPEDGSRALKRVVGLPGDVLVIRDSQLYVNDRAVAEPYVDHASIDGYYSRTYEVPADSVFMLGDNRGNSVDSRDYGVVAARDLIGRALLRVWPILR